MRSLVETAASFPTQVHHHEDNANLLTTLRFVLFAGYSPRDKRILSRDVLKVSLHKKVRKRPIEMPHKLRAHSLTHTENRPEQE